MPSAWGKNMGKACSETESSVFCAKRSPRSEKGSVPRASCSFRKSKTLTRSTPFKKTSNPSLKERKCLKINAFLLFLGNWRYLCKFFNRYNIGKAICIRLICFYQKKLSRHTCLYTPTCSEYTKRCINNFGVIIGILLGTWRILRCNPLSKGGFDPAPERPLRVKWLL